MKIDTWVAIAPYTSWKIGGKVQYLLQPSSLNELSSWLRDHPSIKSMMLGLGSNVLFSDGNIDMAVILSRSFLKESRQTKQGTWEVEAGVNCAKVARDATVQGYRDAAFFCGIPGSIGGALRMNAGAFGGETWSYVQWVEILSLDGEIIRYYPHDFDVSYRSVIMPTQGYFVKACLKFSDHTEHSQQPMIAKLLSTRAKTQPIGQPSCGSVFRNPYPNHSGALIEASGLKGYTIGGAQVSQKHANFIINIDHASAMDVLSLMSHIREVVKRDHGVSLVHEVLYVSNDGSIS